MWRMACGGLLAVIFLGLLVGVSSGTAAGFIRPEMIFSQFKRTPAPITLFEDDFATYSQRWQETESPKASAAYLDEMFNIMIVSPGVSLWSVPDFATPLHDYHVAVTVYPQAGEADAQFGLVLDYEDPATFYAFVISLDGNWYFLRWKDDEWRDLTPPDAENVELPPNELRLQVDVTGNNTFSFWLDDQVLHTVTIDGSLAGAVFGLIARAEHGFIDVSFDDITVTTLAREDEE